MPTLSINGHNVQVDDSFLKLSPDQQNTTVDEIAKSLGGGAQAQPQDDGSFLNNAVRAVGRGTLGLGSYLDEADAATNAVLAPLLNPLFPKNQQLKGDYGQRYDQSLAVQRGMDKSFDAAHPIASTGLQVAGGLASGGAALSAAPAVAKAALGIGGRTLLGKTGASLASGATLGALQGYGAGEGGLENRSINAVESGMVGGSIGAAVPSLAGAAGRGFRAIAGRAANAVSPLSTRATNLINRDLSKEGLTLPEANARANAFGPQGMIADVSPSMRLRTEQIAQSDNPGRSGVIDTLKARSGGTGDRINFAFDTAAGARPNVQKTLQTIMDARSQQAAPLYSAAFEAGDKPIWGNELERLSAVPEVQQAMHSAVNGWQRSQIANGYGAMNPGAMVDEGNGGLLKFLHGKVPVFPNLQFWDYTKNALDDMISHEIKPNGTLTKKGHDLTIITRKLRDTLDRDVPEYAAARQAWAGPTKTMDAFNEGRMIFSSKIHPDMLDADLANMSQAEKDAYRLGVRAAADEAMGRVRNGALKGRQLLDSDFNERKIMSVLGRDDGQKLINSLMGEQAMADTANQVLGNSATSRRMDNPFRAQQKSATETPPGIARSAANLRLGDALAQGWQHIGNALERRKVTNLAQELGPFLTARGSDRDKVVQAITKAEIKRKAVKDAIDIVMTPKRQQLIRALLQSGQLSGVHPTFP